MSLNWGNNTPLLLNIATRCKISFSMIMNSFKIKIKMDKILNFSILTKLIHFYKCLDLEAKIKPNRMPNLKNRLRLIQMSLSKVLI